ncbi:MAG TPA: hypothetical protein VJQ84_06135 [Solirubrobacterales bacterium]|nr:hypothetical protein [Solirubrobacterales bacterium]
MSNSLKSKVVRRAAKTGVKHTAHGTAAKLKRSPMRTSTLLALGVMAGFLVGRLAAKPAPPLS